MAMPFYTYEKQNQQNKTKQKTGPFGPDRILTGRERMQVQNWQDRGYFCKTINRLV